MDHVTSLILIFSLVISTSVNIVASSTSAKENDASYYIGPELEKELRLTKTEKIALDKLKLAVPKEPNMPYLQMELYQIRWLRAHNLDVDRTLRKLKELIQLRRRNRVANFWTHDWSDLFSNSPFELEGHTKDGLPILTLSTSKFDLRRIMIQGKRERLHKYCVNIGFEAMEKMIELNKDHPNITQIAFLANLDNFSPITHACPLCLQFYLFILELNEVYLPRFTRDIIILNAPQAYGVFLEIVKPVLSEHTRSALKFLGTNKNKWKPYVDSKIDPKQLSWEFGGTRETQEDY